MKKILIQKESFQKTYDDQKLNLWELEGHIKKVK